MYSQNPNEDYTPTQDAAPVQVRTYGKRSVRRPDTYNVDDAPTQSEASLTQPPLLPVPPPPPPPPPPRPPRLAASQKLAPLLQALRLQPIFESFKVTWSAPMRIIELALHGQTSHESLAAAIISMPGFPYPPALFERLVEELLDDATKTHLDAIAVLVQSQPNVDKHLSDRLTQIAREHHHRMLRYALYPKTLSPLALNGALDAQTLQEFFAAMKALTRSHPPDAPSAIDPHYASCIAAYVDVANRSQGRPLVLYLFPVRPRQTFRFWLKIRKDEIVAGRVVLDKEAEPIVQIEPSTHAELEDLRKRYNEPYALPSSNSVMPVPLSYPFQ